MRVYQFYVYIHKKLYCGLPPYYPVFIRKVAPGNLAYEIASILPLYLIYYHT